MCLLPFTHLACLLRPLPAQLLPGSSPAAPPCMSAAGNCCLQRCFQNLHAITFWFHSGSNHVLAGFFSAIPAGDRWMYWKLFQRAYSRGNKEDSAYSAQVWGHPVAGILVGNLLASGPGRAMYMQMCDIFGGGLGSSGRRPSPRRISAHWGRCGGCGSCTSALWTWRAATCGRARARCPPWSTWSCSASGCCRGWWRPARCRRSGRCPCGARAPGPP